MTKRLTMPGLVTLVLLSLAGCTKPVDDEVAAAALRAADIADLNNLMSLHSWYHAAMQNDVEIGLHGGDRHTGGHGLLAGGRQAHLAHVDDRDLESPLPARESRAQGRARHPQHPCGTTQGACIGDDLLEQ